MRAQVNSEKHIVQTTLSTVLAGQVGTVTFINATQGGSPTLANLVDVGTTVKAIFVEYWLLAAAAQPTTATIIIEKLQNGQEAANATEMGDLYTYTNKRNILITHQGIVPDANSNPVPIIREWIKIPKGKQRFGLGDTLRMTIKSITEDTEFCGLAIYKAYT